MISDVLDTLRGLVGKRVRLCFYVGEGSGIQNFTEVGYIREVNDHRIIMEVDPKVEGRYPILRTTFLTEFVAVYAVDELDPEKPIPELEDEGAILKLAKIKSLVNASDGLLSGDQLRREIGRVLYTEAGS